MIQRNQENHRAGVTRIGVFIDGGYFSHVSSYYRFHHQGGGYISLNGLKEYLRHRIAKDEESDLLRCRIVDAHYFRGRLSARELQERNALYGERVFEDALLYSGFESHHQPVSQGRERGIDVMLALEAFHCASSKGLDVCVLVAGDGDFIPLVRKLHGLGTRVVVVGFNVQAMGNDGAPVTTRCSFHLMQEATYPLMVSEEISNTPPGTNPLVDALFLPVHEGVPAAESNDFSPSSESASLRSSANHHADIDHHADADHPAPSDSLCAASVPAATVVRSIAPSSKLSEESPDHRWSGHICFLQDSYGFLLRDGDEKRFFFFKTDLLDVRYEDLVDGQSVSFVPSSNERGPCAKRICLG